jgi:hypothetical protein
MVMKSSKDRADLINQLTTHLAGETKETIARAKIPRVGFAVIVFDLDGSALSYNSNGRQEDMARLLREVADRLAGGGESRIVIIH